MCILKGKWISAGDENDDDNSSDIAISCRKIKRFRMRQSFVEWGSAIQNLDAEQWLSIVCGINCLTLDLSYLASPKQRKLSLEIIPRLHHFGL